MSFTTLDSGKRQEYPTGARRDTEDGKPRFDLIPVDALRRVADLYARGAAKYDDWNWTKGISKQRCYGSALRHIYQFALGEKTEDHLAAAVFNLLALMHYEETGRTDLDDMLDYKKGHTPNDGNHSDQ